MRVKQLATAVKDSLVNNEVILLVGSPGVGKTDIITQVAASLGWPVIIEHPVVADPTDYKGMPFVVMDSGKSEARFLPFNNLDALIKAESPVVFFIDDMGQASVTVQAALMQLLLGGKINGHQISPHVRIVAATNKKEDRAGVTGMIEPLKGRCTIFEAKPHIQDWTDWALRQEFVDVKMIGAAQYMPNLIEEWKPTMGIENCSNPRNFAAACRYHKRHLNGEISEDLMLQAFIGRLGKGAAQQVKAFLDVYSELPTYEEIVKAPASAKIFPKRPDCMYATATSLGTRAKKEHTEKLLTYMKRAGVPEFELLFIKILMSRPGSDAKNSEAVQKWVLENETRFFD